MDAIFWTATVLSIIGNTAFTLSALFKNKRVAVAMQTSNHLLSSVAQLLQKAYSGMAQDVVCFVKNVILLFVPEKMVRVRIVIPAICIVAGIGAGISLNVLLNGSVWYGFLPVISSAVLSTTILLCYAIDFGELKQLLILKCGMIFNSVFWSIYGIYIQLYPVTAFNCVTIALSIFAIAKYFVLRKRNKKTTEENTEGGDGE